MVSLREGHSSLSCIPCLRKKKPLQPVGTWHTSSLIIYSHLLPFLLPFLCTLIPAPRKNLQRGGSTSWSPPDKGLFCSWAGLERKDLQATTLARVVLTLLFPRLSSRMKFLSPDLSCYIFREQNDNGKLKTFFVSLCAFGCFGWQAERLAFEPLCLPDSLRALWFADVLVTFSMGLGFQDWS